MKSAGVIKALLRACCLLLCCLAALAAPAAADASAQANPATTLISVTPGGKVS